jgi:hypothetical protein
MAALVAKSTRGHDVVRFVLAAILARLQVFGRTTQMLGLRGCHVVAGAKARRIIQPNGEAAVVAAAGLANECSRTGMSKQCGHEWLQ